MSVRFWWVWWILVTILVVGTVIKWTVYDVL